MQSHRWRQALLGFVALVVLANFFGRGPMPQSQLYHRFADSRILMGIPNAGDVLTNLAFLIPGILGLFHCFRPPGQGAIWSWRAVFLGTTLVCCGSGYYHWRPEDWTLLWDRLPMTISFMGLFSALLCEQVLPGSREKFVLLPLLLLGLGSVVYWYAVDDLRLYYWVQMFPLLCTVIIPALFPARFSHQGYLFLALGLYVLAKVTESHDLEVLQATGNLISGHSMKHLLAGLAAFLLFLLVRQRRPVGNS